MQDNASCIMDIHSVCQYINILPEQNALLMLYMLCMLVTEFHAGHGCQAHPALPFRDRTHLSRQFVSHLEENKPSDARRCIIVQADRFWRTG